MNKDGLKLLKAEVKNFKNIEQKSIDFGGKSAIILGANRKGKSSLIQALMSPMNSKLLPAKPIKDGEDTASIELTIGGSIAGKDVVYHIDMYFSEKYHKGHLVITDEDGGKIPGGKSMVETIVGNIGFDILEFIDLGLTKDGKVSKPGVMQQIEVLKGFMPLEARKKLMALDNESKEVYDERAEINKDIKSNESKLKDVEMDPEEIEKYSTKLDDSDVKKKMNEIGETISTFDKVTNGLESKKKEFDKLSTEMEELKKLMEQKIESLKTLNTDIEKGEKWLKGKTRPSMDSLTEELNEIQKHNDIHKLVMERQEFSKKVRELSEKSESKGDRLAAIKSEKAEIFTENPLPVKGLEFTEEEILYDGLPFNENQHPSSTIIGIGIKVAMAMNPNLKVLVIKDGSLLDKKTLNFILKLVEKQNYQLFIEMVDFDGEKDVTVEFIEKEVK